jgi:putative membrane protein
VLGGLSIPLVRSIQLLRYLLALDRTRLANERTLLAYIRTALALLATGVGLLFLFPSVWVRVAGWAFGLLSLGLVVWGVRRYRSVSRDLLSARGSEQVPDE